MGFRLLGRAAELTSAKLNDDLLHRLECKACPLDKVTANMHGHMAPTGAKRPLVYVLGEAPGKQEDEQGRQFIGGSGQILRRNIPDKYIEGVRFNNTVRCRPPKNRTPTHVEIECCRPSIIRDIELARPKAIFGFGNVPLQWVCGMTGISYWRGRRMPVVVGDYACWYYPMLHPAFLLRQGHGHATEEERMFRFDLERAFEELEDLPPAPWPHTAEQARKNTHLLTTVAEIEKALAWAADRPVVGIDYETDRLRPYDEDAALLTVAFSDGEQSYAFGLDHPGTKWTPAEGQRIMDAWAKFLSTATGVKAVHNLAFELEWTGRIFGSELLRAGVWEDSATQAAILDERVGKTKPGCFSLEFLCQVYFGFNVKKVFSLDRSTLARQPLERVMAYNALDAKYHALLWQKQHEAIKAEGLGAAYKLALRRVPTVVLTQLKGVPVNQVEVTQLQTKYAHRIEKVEQQIADDKDVRAFKRRTGRTFNPSSNPDVLSLFHDQLGCKECEVQDKYTKEPKLSCDESVLSQIKHPLAQLLMTLRHARKRKSTYIDPLSPDFEQTCMYDDGMIHAQFNTLFAETGRLSCEAPNLQNFPKREDEAREVRRAIQAPKGCQLLAFDYGQIEARVIAMFTKDKTFCKSLWERYDIHGEWAERIARAYPARIGGKQNLTDKKTMKDFRTDIKNQWTFPLFFGASMESAAGYLKIPIQVIKPLYREFWKQFAGVKEWQEQQLKFYQKYGYVACLTGRRRRGPLSVNKVMNSPIQGTAAEIVMDCMCRLSETGDPDLQPEINIHDDLTWVRVPEKQLEEFAERVLNIMLDVPFKWVNVPITVELASGPNWMDMKEVGNFSSDEWFPVQRS
jgi:DNA polymerase-1